MPEKQQHSIVDDLLDAYRDGIGQGFMYGYITSVLGPDWVTMYDRSETEKQMVKSAWFLAKKAKEMFKKDELAASAVILQIVFDNYKAVENGP